MRRALTISILVCTAIFMALPILRAIEPVPLPALQLLGLDGQAVKTSDLPSKGNWLLIYVNPKSHFCDEMLKLLKRDQYPDLEGSAVFVVAGTVDDTKAMQAKYPDLAAASWYADPDHGAFVRLKLHGMPTVIGINQQTMRWTVNGVVPDPNTFRTILTGWIQQRVPPKSS
jgi:hypothetical protein